MLHNLERCLCRTTDLFFKDPRLFYQSGYWHTPGNGTKMRVCANCSIEDIGTHPKGLC